MVGILSHNRTFPLFSTERGFGNLHPGETPNDNRVVDLKILGKIPLLNLLVFIPERGFVDMNGLSVPPPTGPGTLFARHTITKTIGQEMFTGISRRNKLAEPTMEGLWQAYYAGRTLDFFGIRPDVIVRPDLERTSLSAALIALGSGSRGLPFTLAEAIERRFGVFDAQRRSVLPIDYYRDMNSLSRTAFHHTTGVESLGEFLSRGALTLATVDMIMDEIIHMNPNAFNMVVWHGGATSYVIGALLAKVVNDAGEAGKQFIALPANEVTGEKGKKLPFPYRDQNEKHPERPFVLELKLNPNEGVWIPKELLDLIKGSTPDGRRTFAPLARALSRLNVDDMASSFVQVTKRDGIKERRSLNLFEGLESPEFTLTKSFKAKVMFSAIINQDWYGEYLGRQAALVLDRITRTVLFNESQMAVWVALIKEFIKS